MARITADASGKRAEDQDGYQYIRKWYGWLKVGHRDDPPCSGSGYSHGPHGHCPGYGTDRT